MMELILPRSSATRFWLETKYTMAMLKAVASTTAALPASKMRVPSFIFLIQK
jgi:hypothetical protein